MQLDLKWDSRDLDFWRNRQTEKALVTALSKAGGDAIRAVKAASNRSVRQRKRFKVKKVNDALALTYPKGRKEISTLVWRMDVSGDPVRVAEVSHRQTKKGVSFSINKRRSFIKSAFIATMRSGHTGVFMRVGKKRLPIDEVFTSRISDVFRDSGMIPAITAAGQRKFDSAFARVLKLELAR